MLKNLIILPDGTEISSGNPRDNAIISATYTQKVNSGTDLTLGSACSNCVEIKLYTPDGALSIEAGDEFAYYKVADDGSRTKIGLFTAEKPTRTGAGTYKVTAYDRVSWLDKDLTDWLASLEGWPYSVYDFAAMVCEACGLELANTTLPNGEYQVQKFAASSITGRKIMKWLGEICCRFVIANSDGEIKFAWYTDKGVSIAPSGSRAYFSGGLTYEDYEVSEVQKVQIQVTSDDVGTIYPNISDEVNTYKITGNYLLTADSATDLTGVAQTIYEQLQGVTYTPCTVSLQTKLEIEAGDIVHITDRNGVTITAYVMERTQTGQKDKISCTGNTSRDSSSAVNEQSYSDLAGKILEIKSDVDGWSVKNADTVGKVAELSLTVDSFDTRIADAENNASEAKQTAEGFDTRVTNAENNASEAKQTAEGFEARVSSVEGNYSTLNQTVDGLTGRVESAEGNIATLLISSKGVDMDTSWNEGDVICRLVSVIGEEDGKGVWSAKYYEDDTLVSGLYFDYTNSRYVFDGELQATIGYIGGFTIAANRLWAGEEMAEFRAFSGTIVMNETLGTERTFEDIVGLRCAGTFNYYNGSGVETKELGWVRVGRENFVLISDDGTYYIEYYFADDMWNAFSTEENVIREIPAEYLEQCRTFSITSYSGTQNEIDAIIAYVSENATQPASYDNMVGVYVGTDGIGLGAGKFRVSKDGEVHLEAGTIGEWTLDSGLEYKAVYQIIKICPEYVMVNDRDAGTVTTAYWKDIVRVIAALKDEY